MATKHYINIPIFLSDEKVRELIESGLLGRAVKDALDIVLKVTKNE